MDRLESLSTSRRESGTKSVFPKRSPDFQKAFLFTCLTSNYKTAEVLLFDSLRCLTVTCISKPKASRQTSCHICELCSTRRRSVVSCCANFLSASTEQSKECGRAGRSWTTLISKPAIGYGIESLYSLKWLIQIHSFSKFSFYFFIYLYHSNCVGCRNIVDIEITPAKFPIQNYQRFCSTTLVFSVVELQLCSRVGSYQYFYENFSFIFMVYFNSECLKSQVCTIKLNLVPQT